MTPRQHVSLVITDLDNTLFDWLKIWYDSFKALLDSVIEISGISADILIPEVKKIHERHGTAEYAFLLEELPSLRRGESTELVIAQYTPAIDAFRNARRAAMKLYPGVRATLDELKKCGCLLVAYTESMGFYSNYRMRHLDLDLVFDFIYSPPDHGLPQGLTPEAIRYYPADAYKLRATQHRHTPAGEVKPNPALLTDIIRELGGEKDRTIYIGDSKMKDVVMAQDAHVTDVWAKYGDTRGRPEYELLKKVTHWPEALVQQEKQSVLVKASTHILKDSFSDLLNKFTFVPFVKSS
jgi:phosphoglycolate phosphatase